MNLHNVITDVFQCEDYEFIPINKGFTNKNYKLTINGKAYIVRVPCKDSEHIVNRNHEAKAIQAIQDLHLDVPILYFDEQSGIKISEYIPHLWEFKECPFEDKIERTAIMMRKLHHSNKKIHAEFHPIQRYQQYKKQVRHPLYDLSEFEGILDQIHMLSCEHVLCHNDWVSGNILFGTTRNYLIDYEYSADNDPIFDVMSFLSENDITDPLLRKRFYDVYFDSFRDDIKIRLTLWEVFHNLLWCTWAIMMWEKRKEPIYKKIANDKFAALHTVA